jgi:Tfp pilus assembly protein PilF
MNRIYSSFPLQNKTLAQSQRIHNKPVQSGRWRSNVLWPMTLILGLCVILPESSAVAAVTTDRLQASARLNNIGVALMNQQLLDKALQKFQASVQADPASSIPLVNEGIAYIYLRKLPEAEEALKKVVAADPTRVRAWYCLGLTYFSSGSQDPALINFQHALALDPHDPDIHYFIGSIYFSQKKYSDAEAEFKTAVEAAPLHASAQFGLARALQREGKLDEAREHLKRFQEITASKIGVLMSAAYGEQGHYAIAQDMLATPASAGAMIPVTFVPADTSSSTSTAASEPTSEKTGGICMLDLEGNGSKDIVAMTRGDGFRAYRLAPSGSIEVLSTEQTGLRIKGDGVACAVGDYDNDGRPDLAIALTDRVVLFHNLGRGKFADTTMAAGIRPLNQPQGLTFVDFDHDGDLDLFVTGTSISSDAGPNVLWRNNGNSTFTEWSKPTGLAGMQATRGAVLSDINNDRAIDLIVGSADGSPHVYENQREGAFKQQPLYVEKGLSPTRGIVVSDFNKDGWMDVALTHAGAPGVSLWRNVQGQQFERIPLSMPEVTGAWGITPIDFDNDGWIDLAVIVETTKGTELRVLRNTGASGFVDVSEALGLRKLNLHAARSVISADIDGDGAADLVVTRESGDPMVLHNVGGGRNHSLRIDLTGLADNKTAIGTKVEVFSDGNWQKFEVAGSSGYMSQGPTEIVAGLGSSDRADVVRLLWPTGVPQDELDLSSAKPAMLTELDRRGSSCPVLFAWDGAKYQFITDVVGAAVIGHWISPTSRNQSDTDEWVKVDGDKLRGRNGNLSVRFGEPMEEINYIDKLRLVAVDHPVGTEAYPDERFLSEPPFASGKVVLASEKTHPPAGAWDNDGHDVLATLASRDKKYVRDFTNLSYAGFANTHELTLDLGEWSATSPLRLFLYGYVEYFSASSMYAAWQAGIEPRAPSIEAQLPDGSWKTVIEDAGFPAGLPRMIVVDLTGKLPANARRIRIKTNLQIYWDQILIDNAPDVSRLAHQTELPLSSAHLAFRGYPRQIDGETPGDLTYDYQSISMTGPFQWQRGNYTRYGDVTPLLMQRDNHYVIFGSGEDIDAEFSDAALPALPADWKRDYFFYADGFVKDMDFYEALPFTVADMPFDGMSTYPYPPTEHFPDDASTLAYQLDWNDRVETGDRTQRFQFNYKPVFSQPIAPPGPGTSGGKQ